MILIKNWHFLRAFIRNMKESKDFLMHSLQWAMFNTMISPFFFVSLSAITICYSNCFFRALRHSGLHISEWLWRLSQYNSNTVAECIHFSYNKSKKNGILWYIFCRNRSTHTLPFLVFVWVLLSFFFIRFIYSKSHGKNYYFSLFGV